MGRSSFYDAESAYEEAQSRPTSAAEHIYEEIPEHHRHQVLGAEQSSSSVERPLPPIPEKTSKAGKYFFIQSKNDKENSHFLLHRRGR